MQPEACRSYAIAAAVAWPNRPVFCIIGDGGLSMLLGELITVAAYKLNIRVGPEVLRYSTSFPVVARLLLPC